MWTALGLYTLGPKRRNKRGRTWKRKNKDDRSVIIPEATFLSDPLYLPALREIRIQDEAEELWDEGSSNSISRESEYKNYAKFKYSMGGNLQLYDKHIALSSPKRKVQKSCYSPKRLSEQNELSPTGSEEYTESLELESMDMSSLTFKPNKNTESMTNKGSNTAERAGDTSVLRASLEDLKLSGPVVSAEEYSVTLHKTVPEVTGSGNLRTNSADRCQTDGIKQRQNVKRSRTENRSGNALRDYSPIRPEEEIVVEAEKPLGTTLGVDSQNDAKFTYEEDKLGIVSEKCATSKEEDTCKTKEGEDVRSGFYNEDKNKYDRTLLYVNRQRETIQTGEYPELDFDMSDLSSDVFTDSEVPTSGPLSLPLKSDANMAFYPDSPTSEYTFSKTPCSSRKNSVDSLLSDVDSLSDMDFTQEITQALSETVNEKPKRPFSGSKGSTSNTRIPKMKNEKSKNGSRTNSSDKRKDDPLEKPESKKKTNCDSKVKAKINSFQNIHHVPGGGNTKIFSQTLTHLKNVEPRTDTHCVETYSHLPSEFQEIARRLAKQDKQLRSNNGSFSGRSRSGKLSASSGTLSASTASLTSAGSTKRATRPASRTPSIRSRPPTPSLSRSHPATYVTPYDSRSRPSSRPSSRPGSRSSSPNSRSRNTSPVRGSRSRGSSPVGNHRRIPKSGKSHSHFGSRTARTTGVSNVHHLNSPRSVFQVVPAMRK